MEETKVAERGRISLAEFERRLPKVVDMVRVELEKGMVRYAVGKDKTMSIALMWNSRGKAFARDMVKGHEEKVDFNGDRATRFNGFRYVRDESYDLI